MTTFVDYAWWQVSPAQLKAMGFSGAMRYGNPGNSKSATPAEVANLRAAGFDFGDIFEREANRAAQGFAAGAADATAANRFADTLSYPKECTLWYAVDFDASVAQVQHYFDGIGSAGGRPYAPYGGFVVVDGLVYSAPYGWQTVAWSHGRVSTRAGLYQDGFSGNYDSNRVLADDFGQWRAGTVPTPPPHPSALLITQEEAMRADKRPSKYNGHDVYDVFVTGVGTEAQQTTADGRKVRCVRSVLRVDTTEAIDAQIQIVADGQDLGSPGLPATGGEFACPASGRASIVNLSDAATDLIVDYSEVWA